MERKLTSEDAYVNPITLDGVYVEISMNPNDQYRLWTFLFLIRLTEQSVNRHLRQFNIPEKKKTLTSWAQHETLQETIAFENKRKSLLVIQIKLN